MTRALSRSGPLTQTLHRTARRAAAALVVVLATTAAHAQSDETYPARPVRMIVPYAPGGSSDNVARIVAERLASLLGQPVIVDNRGGAAGTIGAQAAQQAKPDGYTLLMAPTAVFAITPHMRKVPYDPLNGFETVAMLAKSFGIVAVRKDLPVSNLTEFVALAKKQPGKLSFGSAGPGSITQLYGELLKQGTGIDILHVPFKGSADSLNALLGGQIDLIIDPVGVPQSRTGGIKAIAIAGDRRIAELPDVPTAAESGISLDLPSWFGLFAPKGTPPAIVAKISGETAKVLREPETEQKMLRLGLFAAYESPAAFAKQLRTDDQLFAELIRKAGIKE